MQGLGNFSVSRKSKRGVHNFSDVFPGFEGCREIWKFYGGKEKFLGVLEKTEVRVCSNPRIFFIDVKQRRVAIDKKYLEKMPTKTLYLDCIHEMVHIKQLRDGKDLFNKRYEYVDRPTEVQAYRLTMPAAKRLKMSRKQIINYLRLPWTNKKQHTRLVKNVIGE